MHVLILTCPDCGAKTPTEHALHTFTCVACGKKHDAECLGCTFGQESACGEHSTPEVNKQD